jgi:uncharacterized iron-regulated membrane protein
MLTKDIAVRQPESSGWLSYRTVWRWHFYAGIFSIPFVLWLSITGSIYLFKPQVELWLDRSYDSPLVSGLHASAEEQIMAALTAIPGSSLHYYQLPRSSQSAVQVIVGRDTEEYRVYVHPQTLKVLKVDNEDMRPMKIVQRLHGELLLGDMGSMIVELAASWAIILIITGLYLWWPRQSSSLAGILFVRIHMGRRILWRDLHAITGIWISAFALFLLFSGMPWAKSWGGNLKRVRAIFETAPVRQDWTTGRSSELENRMALNRKPSESMESAHAEHMHHHAPRPQSYAPVDRIIAAVAPMQLPEPVLISPPAQMGEAWTAKSDTQNRPLRAVLTVDAQSGRILKRVDFGQRPMLDRIIGTSVAAHEGQLFGIANQLLGLFTALGLITISVSAIVLWWRRRPNGVLGAPVAISKPRFTFGLVVLIVGLGLYLPAFGLSLIAVIITEHIVLRRLPSTQKWLGLQTVS